MNSKYVILFIIGWLLPGGELRAEGLPEIHDNRPSAKGQRPIVQSESNTASTTEEDYSVESQKRQELIYPSNFGHPGIFRLRSAESLPRYSLSFGIGGEFYSTSNGAFGEDASTIAEHLFLGFSPLDRFTVAVERRSSSTTFGNPPQLISSLGDFNFSLSYSFPINESLALAPIGDILIASNFNSLAPAGNTLSAGIGAAATFSFFPLFGVPLFAHANLIYHMPQIRGGTTTVPEPETYFRFSRYHTITWILGGEIKLGDFSPFVEFKESVQAASNLNFGNQPSAISIGTRITPLSNKSLSVLLGGDIGIGRGLIGGVPYSPQWQVLGQLSYTVALSQTERKHYVTTADVNVVDRKFIIQKNIIFKVGSAEIDSASFPVLDQIAHVIKENNVKKLLIVGHTDSSHTEDYNLKLSLDRANSVKRYLVQKGIAEESLMTQGYGKRKPKASNLTEEGRTLNRRVEFFILE